MVKKITAVLILVCTLLGLLIPCANAANSTFYKLVAKDYFDAADYPGKGYGTSCFYLGVNDSTVEAAGGKTGAYKNDGTGNPVIAGSGWESNWLIKDANGNLTEPSDSSYDFFHIYWFSGSNNRGFRFNNNGTVIYRKLKDTISFNSSEGVYTFSLKNKSTKSSAGNSRKSFAYKIGESVTVGYNWNNTFDKVIPYITVGENTTTATSAVTMLGGGSSTAADTLTASIKLSNTEKDIITFTVAYSESDFATVTAEADLTEEVKYIAIDGYNVYVDEVLIEYDNPERYNIINGIINGTVTDEEAVEESFKFISTYTGDNRGVLINALKAATGDNPGRQLKLNAMIPANGGEYLSAYAYKIQKLELEYNFALQEGAVFNLNKTTGGTTLVASSIAEDNKVVINLEQPLENGVSYEIVTSGTDFKGDAVEDIDFIVSPIYKLSVKDGDSFSEGSKLEWDENGAVVTAELKNSEGDTIASTSDSSLYSGYKLEECGEFLLTFTASKNGYTDTLSDICFYVDEDFAPVAENVKIEGIPATGETLTGSYDWSDQNNGDTEFESIYEWYRITTEGEELVGNELTYTLTVEDENADLRFEVTPGANSLGNPYGSTTASEIFKGAYKPVITNPEKVKISGSIYDELEVDTSSLIFEDLNGDEIDEPLVKWYAEGTNEYICDGKLTVTETVYEKSVYATVTPVSTTKPYYGNEVKTESIVMPARPIVSNVRIEGNTSLNSVLTAYYSFSDVNLDVEGENSIYEWKDSNGNLLGNARTLTVTNSIQGKTITVTVIGVSEKAPCNSLPVTSATLTIPTGSYGIGSGGIGGVVGGFGYSSGNTSSGGGSSSGSSATTSPVAPVTPDEPAKETVFADVYGHWAQEYVTVLLEKGIVAKDESFRPDDSISRAEMLAMLFRSADVELSTYAGHYGDVQSGDWYADYIQTALDAGIISPDDNFRPNDGITREEAAKIITIMLKLSSESNADFADADTISGWATEFVNAVYEAGIFKGDDNGNFNAKASLTRAETATVIYRLLNENAFSNGGAE